MGWMEVERMCDREGEWREMEGDEGVSGILGHISYLKRRREAER